MVSADSVGGSKFSFVWTRDGVECSFESAIVIPNELSPGELSWFFLSQHDIPQHFQASNLSLLGLALSSTTSIISDLQQKLTEFLRLETDRYYATVCSDNLEKICSDDNKLQAVAQQWCVAVKRVNF